MKNSGAISESALVDALIRAEAAAAIAPRRQTRKRKGSFVLLAIGISAASSACTPPSESMPPIETPEDIGHRYESQASDAVAHAKRKEVYPVCPAPAGYEKCGTIAERLLAPARLQKLVRKVCSDQAPDGNSVSETCLRQVIAGVRHYFAVRYPRAKPDEIESICAQRSCASLELEEFAWLESHNNAVHGETMAELERITSNHASAQQDARAERQSRAAQDAAWRARMQAAAAAFQQAGQSFQQAPTSASGAMAEQAGCSSDYECGFGNYCVKPQFQARGACAKVVNQFGVPTYAPPRANSIAPAGPGNCRFDTDCSPGFQCVQGNCMQ
jgi:hypothetical protein